MQNMLKRKRLDFKQVNLPARVFYALSLFVAAPLVCICLTLILVLATVACMLGLPVMILQGKKL